MGCSAARRRRGGTGATRTKGVVAVPKAGATRSTTSAVADISESTWEAEVLNSDKPVLVDFWAEWCGPCKLISPIVEWAATEFPDVKVVKVDCDPNPNLVEKYKVYGLPTVMIFKDGEKLEASHNEGAVTKDKLRAIIEANI